MTRLKVGALRPAQRAALIVMPVLFAFAALCIGRIELSPASVFQSIAAKLFGGDGGDAHEAAGDGGAGHALASQNASSYSGP